MVLCAERRVSWDTEFGPLVKGYSTTCGNDDSKPCSICLVTVRLEIPRRLVISNLDCITPWGGPDSVFVLADLVCGSSGPWWLSVCGCVRG